MAAMGHDNIRDHPLVCLALSLIPLSYLEAPSEGPGHDAPHCGWKISPGFRVSQCFNSTIA
jgi:hypothetical protein